MIWIEEDPYACYQRGGPWLHPDSLTVYLELMKEIGSIWLLKDVHTNRIIGEADFVWSSEPPPLGNLLYLTWIAISPDHREQGLGMKLLSNASEKEIENHPAAQYIDTIPEDNLTRGLFERVGLEKWKEICSFELQHISINDSHDLTDLEIEKRDLQEAPIGLVNTGRVWYPTSYCWASIRYSDRLAKVLQRKPQNSIKSYNVEFENNLMVITDSNLGYLWMDPAIVNEEKAYSVALAAMKKNASRHSNSIRFDTFRETLHHFSKIDNDLTVEAKPYMRKVLGRS